MAGIRTITAANSIYTLSVPGVFSTPVALQGFAADAAFSTESTPIGEVTMGVDGNLSAGFVFVPIKQKIQLAADSPSIAVFDAWAAAMYAAKDVFFASGTVDLPSQQATYSMVKGMLTGYKRIPDARKMLQAVEMEITWQSVTKAGI